VGQLLVAAGEAASGGTSDAVRLVRGSTTPGLMISLDEVKKIAI
jgi:hypothetical protein